MSKLAFPFAKGAVADRIRNGTWSVSTLGPAVNWPPVLKSAVDLVLSLSTPGCVVWDKDQIIIPNDSWLDMFGDAGAFSAQALAAAISQAVGNASDQLELPIGEGETRRSASFRPVPLHGEDGVTVGTILTAIDVTARTDLADFLSHLNHTLRSPMGAISSLAALLASSSPLSDEQSQYVKAMRGSIDSTMDQIADLLETTRIEARAIQLDHIAFSPSRLLTDIAQSISSLAGEKSLTVTVEPGEDTTRYVGDPARMRQVIGQLARNAVRFTSSGGVHLALDSEELPDGRRTVRFLISDSGPGIAADKHATLFDRPFKAPGEKRKYTGTAVGLYIAHILVEMMGGTISLQSYPGAGATFTVSVPLERASTEAVMMPVDAQTPRVAVDGAPVALLAEDYEPNILVITTLLQGLGYRVDIATDGLVAVDKARSRNYALALMDLQMPGLTGLQATKQIREAERNDGRPRLPIIGVTAHSLAEDRADCLMAGMDDYLAKPFDAQDLFDKIQNVA